MKTHRQRSCLTLAVLFAVLAPVSAAAQSDILLQLRSGSPQGDRFRVDSAGGFVALGNLGVGIIPFSNEGDRTMWYPFRAAFRSGSITGGVGGCPDCWNDANMGFFSWAGGWNTMARGNYSFAHGSESRAEGQFSVAMGDRSRVHAPAGGPFATAGFAMGSQANVHNRAGVALGELVTSNGQTAVAIGYSNTASADRALALGRGATAAHYGAFVWGGTQNSTQTNVVSSTTTGEFTVRAPGGIRMRSNYTLTTGCNIAAGGGAWSCSSSRTLKEMFVPVNGEEILHRLRATPVTTWNYIAERREVRHMGPMAEDFRAAFGLGDEDTSIGVLDIAGVNMAAVQALERRTAGLREELVDRDRRIAELEARIARLEALLTPGSDD